MLVSRTEALAQDLRRQDLLTRALHEQATREHRPPDPSHPVLLSSIRRVVGGVLLRAGMRHQERLRWEPPVEPAISPPPA